MTTTVPEPPVASRPSRGPLIALGLAVAIGLTAASVIPRPPGDADDDVRVPHGIAYSIVTPGHGRATQDVPSHVLPPTYRPAVIWVEPGLSFAVQRLDGEDFSACQPSPAAMEVDGTTVTVRFGKTFPPPLLCGGEWGPYEYRIRLPEELRGSEVDLRIISPAGVLEAETRLGF